MVTQVDRIMEGRSEMNKHTFNPSNAELNTICHLLALLGVHHILHVSRTGVNTPKKTSLLQSTRFK